MVVILFIVDLFRVRFICSCRVFVLVVFFLSVILKGGIEFFLKYYVFEVIEVFVV